MTFADLRALHAVIGAAIDDIERIYRPPSSLRRPSQSSMSTTSSTFAGRSPSKPRSPSIPRSSTSTDSDLEDDDGSDSMPPTPLTASNIRMQQSANSVRFASGRKRRERSYTLSALPPSSSSPGPMPPPILKQPPLDFPALDSPVSTFETSGTLPKSASPATVTPASSPRVQTAPLLSVDVESLGTSPSVDPTQRRREWHRKCEDLTTHPEVIKAVNKIVAACGQLSAAVQKPFLTVCDAAMGYNLPACLRFLEAAHIVEMLREAGMRGLSSTEIAQKIDAGYNISEEDKPAKSVDPNKLSHILRLLATHHITREVRPDVFANNRVSSVIDSGKAWSELATMHDAPESKYEGTDGIAAFVGLCTDELFKASAYLTDCYLFPPPRSVPLPSAPPPVPPKSPSLTTRFSESPTSLAPPSPTSLPPRTRLSVSAPLARLGITGTPNGSMSSLGSLIQDSPGSDVRSEDGVKKEQGDSPMTFARNPHSTPKAKGKSRNRTRTRSSGWGFGSLQSIPASPATPQQSASSHTQQAHAQTRPGLLKRWSSRGFLRAPTPTTQEEVPPMPAFAVPPGTPKSAMLDAPETPRSRVSSTSSIMNSNAQEGKREDPTTPRSPRASSHGQAFGSLAMLGTPRNTPVRSSGVEGAEDMLRTPRSTPSRDSVASESRVYRIRGSASGGGGSNGGGGGDDGKTQRWTPSRESLRGLANKGSFASLKVVGHHRRGGDGPGDADGSGNGLLGPAFDLPVRPSGLGHSVPPVPRLCVDGALLPPPPLPAKSALRVRESPVEPTASVDTKGHTKEQQNETGTGKERQKRGLKPGDEMYAPFNVAFNTGMRYFEWLEKGENVFRLKRFGKAMTGTEKWEVPGSIIGGFPWHDLIPGSIVVDVGGGIGSTSMLLANAFPHLRFVVQDRPPVVEMGVAAWRARNPELLDTGRATFQGHDFFKPQPALPSEIIGRPVELESESEAEELGKKVMGGSEDDSEKPIKEVKPAVFLMRVITHDWPDSYVTRILLRLRQAAGPNTRLLLADFVLPLACVDEDEDIDPDLTEEGEDSDKKITRVPLPGTVRTLAPEGSSLLPNLGKANANAYWLDLTMRVMFNAQERTLRELAALARTAGWQVVQVTRTEGALFGHLVAVPVEIPPETLALPFCDELESDYASSSHDEEATDMHSAPIGDTFLSSTDLPSEATIREGVKSGTSKLNAARHGANGNGRRRRARAYTFTGKDGKEGKGGEGGEVTVRKGFRTILRMLSKAQLKNAHGDEGAANTGSPGESARTSVV